MTCSLLITEAEIDRQTENKNSHLFVQFLNANNVQVRVGNKAGSWERNPLLSHGCLGHSQMSHELPCARVHTDQKLGSRVAPNVTTLTWDADIPISILISRTNITPIITFLLFSAKYVLIYFIDTYTCNVGLYYLYFSVSKLVPKLDVVFTPHYKNMVYIKHNMNTII